MLKVKHINSILTVVIAVKERVYLNAATSGTSALTGLKLKCSSREEIFSSEGNSGIYGQIYENCPLGFTHARLAYTV